MVAIAGLSKKNSEPKIYSLEQYLRREERAVEKHEFYDGKIIELGGGTCTFCEIAANIGAALKFATRPLPTKFHIHGSGLKVYVEPLNSSVYPDVFVLCETPQFWKGRDDLVVNPLLIVEILSRSQQNNDYRGKFDFYRMLPSFKEYVLIDSKKAFVETRFREEEDLWRIKTETKMENSVPLRSLGVSISMEDIYENTVFAKK